VKPAALAFLMLIVLPSGAMAQHPRGFVGAGPSSTVDREWYATVGGGAVVDLGTPWLSGGGQVEALISWPYFAGRGALFGQANLVPRAPMRPFVIGGIGMGEDAGPLVGAGLEVRGRSGRGGVRVSVEDFLARYHSYQPSGMFRVRTGHQIAVRASVLF
jgi:hypothetical protein